MYVHGVFCMIKSEGLRVHLGVLLAAGCVFALLGFAVGEQYEAVGLCGAEVEGNGSHPLGVPLGKADVGLRSLKRNRVQRGHVLTFVRHIALDFHLRVHDSSKPRQFQSDVVVFIHHLDLTMRTQWHLLYVCG